MSRLEKLGQEIKLTKMKRSLVYIENFFFLDQGDQDESDLLIP